MMIARSTTYSIRSIDQVLVEARHERSSPFPTGRRPNTAPATSLRPNWAMQIDDLSDGGRAAFPTTRQSRLPIGRVD